jgi:hypothetical protein
MSNEPALASWLRRGLAHAAWAVIAIIVCFFLILTKQTGHPPRIFFVPVVLVAWVVGHGLIWGVQHLAAKGRRMTARPDSDGESWPVGLRLALVSTGAAALIGIVQVVGTVLQGRWYPYRHVDLWAVMLAVWLAHAACFAGLLLRKRWSRLLSATLATGWALLLGMQIAEQLATVTSTDSGGLLMACGLMVLLLLFAAYLAWSRKAKSFLDH